MEYKVCKCALNSYLECKDLLIFWKIFYSVLYHKIKLKSNCQALKLLHALNQENNDNTILLQVYYGIEADSLTGTKTAVISSVLFLDDDLS